MTLNGLMALFCVISANSGSFRVHCVKVHVRYVLSPVCLSVCLSVARARYSGGCNFRHKYFYGIWYVGHPLTSTNNFTEIVPGEPLRRGFKQNIGSQILDLSKAISRKRCEIGGKLMLITNRIEVAY